MTTTYLCLEYIIFLFVQFKANEAKPQLIIGKRFRPGSSLKHLCKPTSIAVATTGEVSTFRQDKENKKAFTLCENLSMHILNRVAYVIIEQTQRIMKLFNFNLLPKRAGVRMIL